MLVPSYMSFYVEFEEGTWATLAQQLCQTLFFSSGNTTGSTTEMCFENVSHVTQNNLRPNWEPCPLTSDLLYGHVTFFLLGYTCNKMLFLKKNYFCMHRWSFHLVKRIELGSMGRSGLSTWKYQFSYITEVKQRWARLVLGWDTVQVLPECCC